MKKNEIKVGGMYTARVGNKITTVRVDRIMEQTAFGKACTTYAVTNMATGRETRFKSAAKFRGVAKPVGELMDDARKVIASINKTLAGTGAKMSVEGISETNYTLDEEGNEVPAEPELPKSATDPFALDSDSPTLVVPFERKTNMDNVQEGEQRVESGRSSAATSAASLLAKALASHAAKPAPARKHPLTDEQQAVLDVVPHALQLLAGVNPHPHRSGGHDEPVCRARIWPDPDVVRRRR